MSVLWTKIDFFEMTNLIYIFSSNFVFGPNEADSTKTGYKMMSLRTVGRPFCQAIATSLYPPQIKTKEKLYKLIECIST